MLPRLRFVWFAWYAGALFLCAGPRLTTTARAEEPNHRARPRGDTVYRYQKDGREVFTNASVGGHTTSEVNLPELSKVDFSAATREQLQRLDSGVQRAHDEMQNGQRCAAIRASLRIPMGSFLWHEHLRELAVGIALLASALVVFVSWGGRLRHLMPLAPTLACLYLGYATMTRVHRRRDALRDGLRACSSDLPPAQGTEPESIKGRLESASSLQSMVERAYHERAALADRTMRER